MNTPDALTTSPTVLSTLAPADFYQAMGAINTAAANATASYNAAMDNLRILLTEQVARSLHSTHPQAALMFLSVVAEFHHNPDGTPVPTCTGHRQRLAVTSIVDADGSELAPIGDLSPIHYLLERLTPHLGLAPQLLDVETREWVPDVVGA